MIEYPYLKAVHMSCAAASYALFAVRGVWMIRESAMLRARWVRVLPHVIDTVLLASAIAMVLMIRQYPFVAGWVTAKVLALIAYIALGMVALRRGRTKPMRVAAWIAAQLVFLYIVGVAVTKSPSLAGLLG